MPCTLTSLIFCPDICKACFGPKLLQGTTPKIFLVLYRILWYILIEISALILKLLSGNQISTGGGRRRRCKQCQQHKSITCPHKFCGRIKMICFFHYYLIIRDCAFQPFYTYIKSSNIPTLSVFFFTVLPFCAT